MTRDAIDAAFTRFPVLTTDRLRLRQIQLADAEALFAFKSDIAVTQQYGQEPHQSLDDTRVWIQQLQASYDQRDSLFWCLTRAGDDTAIGACVLWNFDAGFHCAEIGYELHPAYGKQGIMAEALGAVLTFAFGDLGLHRVEANPLAGNTPSRSLLLKLGFTYEGTLRQRHFFRDHFEDQLYFGLLSDERPKLA
jgi:ribosomal-protein-alanine N-acetyltransferase